MKNESRITNQASREEGSPALSLPPGEGGRLRRDSRFVIRDSGFTMIELLVVICIIGILVALTTVGIVKALESSRANSTQAMLDTISGALASYATRWGDFPPTSPDEIGLKQPNDTNNGVETLVASLSSDKRGGALYRNEDQLANSDNDSVSGAGKVTKWVFGEKDDQLHEWVDNFGNTIWYMHGKDFAKTRASLTKVVLGPGAEPVTIGPEQNPATKTFFGAGRFQLRSVGRDGKPGTADDIRGSN